jgi:hypothetical protein
MAAARAEAFGVTDCGRFCTVVIVVSIPWLMSIEGDYSRASFVGAKMVMLPCASCSEKPPPQKEPMSDEFKAAAAPARAVRPLDWRHWRTFWRNWLEV